MKITIFIKKESGITSFWEETSLNKASVKGKQSELHPNDHKPSKNKQKF